MSGGTGPGPTTAIEPPPPRRPGLGRALGLALTTLVAGPGFPQALTGRRRAAIAWVAAFGIAWLGLAWTMRAAWAIAGVCIAASVDAGFGIRRTVPPIRWHGRAAAAVAIAAVGVVVVVAAIVLGSYLTPSSWMAPTLVDGDTFFVRRLALGGSPERGDVIVFREPCQPRDSVSRVVAVGGDTVELRCGTLYVDGARVPEELVEGDGCTYAEHDVGEHACSRYRETLGGHTYDVLHEPERPHRDPARVPPAEPRTDFPLGTAPTCATVGAHVASPALPGQLVYTGSVNHQCGPHLHYVVPPDTVFVLGDNRVSSRDSRFWGAVPLANVRGRAIGVWWPPSHAGEIE